MRPGFSRRWLRLSCSNGGRHRCRPPGGHVALSTATPSKRPGPSSSTFAAPDRRPMAPPRAPRRRHGMARSWRGPPTRMASCQCRAVSCTTGWGQRSSPALPLKTRWTSPPVTTTIPLSISGSSPPRCSATRGNTYRVLMRIKESAAGLSAVLDVTSRVQYFQPDSGTIYSISTSEEIRELRDQGRQRNKDSRQVAITGTVACSSVHAYGGT